MTPTTENSPVTKKTKYSHVYENIARAVPLAETPPVEGQQFLATPHSAEVVGVSFSGGQVSFINDSQRKVFLLVLF
jgi:hypothetical protein